jgi:L-seryl-tRNA(Ser) seleniumtransferase
VIFSADKLLGGPQAGIIVGRADLIRRLDRNPFKRALRVGKLTIAALEAVLRLYQAPEHLAERLTTLRLLTRPAVAIGAQAARLAAPVAAAIGAGYEVTSTPLASQIGSGALPVEQLPSHGLAVRRAAGGRGPGIERLVQRLRGLPRPVIGRIADDTLWLDLRCLAEADEPLLLATLGELGA